MLKQVVEEGESIKRDYCVFILQSASNRGLVPWDEDNERNQEQKSE